MNPNYKILLAFTLGVILRILTNPWILGYFNINYSIHKNKIYDAIFFGSLVGFIQILIDNLLLSNGEKLFWIILFISLIIISNYIINKQLFVNEKDLLLILKENYAESIKFSDIQIINKHTNEEIKKFLIEQNNAKRDAINQINILLK